MLGINLLRIKSQPTPPYIAGVGSAKNVRDVENEVKNFDKDKPARTQESYKPVIGLLLASPNVDLVKKQIIPRLDYFDRRANDNVALYMLGYSNIKKNEKYKSITNVKSKAIYFSVDDFDQCRKDLEARTKWRYSGETDIILFNVRKIDEDAPYFIDYDRAICLDIQTMLDDKSIESVSRLFEKIFQFSECCKTNDYIDEISDMLGFYLIKRSFLSMILDWFKKKIGLNVDGLRHVAIRDVSV